MPPNIRAIPRSERLPQAEHSSNRLLVTDSQSTHQTALWQGHNLHICSVFNALIVTPLIVPEQTWASLLGTRSRSWAGMAMAVAEKRVELPSTLKSSGSDSS